MFRILELTPDSLEEFLSLRFIEEVENEQFGNLVTKCLLRDIKNFEDFNNIFEEMFKNIFP